MPGGLDAVKKRKVRKWEGTKVGEGMKLRAEGMAHSVKD